MKKYHNLKSLSVNIGLGIFSILCVLGVLELALPYFVTLEKVSLVYDPILGFRGRPNLEMVHTREMKGLSRIVKTNRFGFHDTEPSFFKKADAKRVVFVGDSFVEAYQVDIADNFCRLTERVLETSHVSGQQIETLNHGVHGYGLGSYALYIKNYVMDWQPDAVVLSIFMGNDLHDNYAPLASSAVPRYDWQEGQLHHLPAPDYSLKMWLRDHVLARSTLVRFVWRRVFANNMKLMQVARLGGLVSTPQMVEESLPQLQGMTAVGQALLGDIATFLRAQDVALFVFVIPDPMLVNMDAFPDKFAEDLVSQRLRKNKDLLMREMVNFLDQNGFLYVLPFDRFVADMRLGHEVYLNGYGHFSKRGHEISAHALAPMIAKWMQ